jgi:hypothetical protein
MFMMSYTIAQTYSHGYREWQHCINVDADAHVQSPLLIKSDGSLAKICALSTNAFSHTSLDNITKRIEYESWSLDLGSNTATTHSVKEKKHGRSNHVLT